LPGVLPPAPRAKSTGERSINYCFFVVWLVAVSVAASRHVVWRDEVRAYSLALQGQTPSGFVAAIHGEGHPLLWYAVLRGAHTVFATSAVLQAVALIVAALAMLVLVARSPFRWPLLGLILLSHFAIFEYVVIARNYGISVLFVFLFAAAYPSQRGRGVVLGVLLFLLANCNVHSVLIAGALLLFWGLDIVFETGLRWTPPLKIFILNAIIAAAGVVVCVLTVFPTFNDAGLRQGPHGLLPAQAVRSAIDPASQFSAITMECVDVLIGGSAQWRGWVGSAAETLMSVLLFGATISLARRPAACIAALAALVGLSVLFGVGAGGEYRHEALWIVLLIALYWICLDADRARPSRPESGDRQAVLSLLTRSGGVAFLAVLVLQAIPGSVDLFRTVVPDAPFSRSRDLARLIEKRPDLRQAIVAADPDYLVEALPYYLPNRVYLMREQRYSAIVKFAKTAQLNLSLSDIIGNARRLRAQSGSPVIILLQAHLDDPKNIEEVREGYDWILTTTPDGIRAFQKETTLLARFGPAASDETFDVYELR
jgi:hypothetical protein